jgi:hypothetical protein
MFGSSLPPVVCERTYVLFVWGGVKCILYCVVFLFCLFFVLCMCHSEYGKWRWLWSYVLTVFFTSLFIYTKCWPFQIRKYIFLYFKQMVISPIFLEFIFFLDQQLYNIIFISPVRLCLQLFVRGRMSCLCMTMSNAYCIVLCFCFVFSSSCVSYVVSFSGSFIFACPLSIL